MSAVKTGSKKEQTRERILQSAARAIRKHGYEGVAVADVMKDAGLTHGGFYAHFESRDALLAAAAEQTAVESAQALAGALAKALQARNSWHSWIPILLTATLLRRSRA